jgi:4-hydroxybenzoate polyprenyltransferase
MQQQETNTQHERTTLKQKTSAIFNAYIPQLLVPLSATIIIGLAYATNLSPMPLAIGILAAVLPLLGANALNNYADWEIDLANQKRTVVHKVLSKRKLLLLAAIPFLLSALVAFIAGPPISWIIAIGLLISLTYSWGVNAKDKLWLIYLWIGFYFGPLAFLAIYYTTAGSLAAASLPITLLFLLGLHFSMAIVKDYGDIKGDAKLGKRTLPVVYGKQKSLAIQVALITATFLLVPVGVFLQLFPAKLLAVLAFYPLAVLILLKVGRTEVPEKNNAYLNKMRVTALAAMITWAAVTKFL